MICTYIESEPLEEATNTTELDSLQNWHEKLGHLNECDLLVKKDQRIKIWQKQNARQMRNLFEGENDTTAIYKLNIRKSKMSVGNYSHGYMWSNEDKFFRWKSKEFV